MHNLNCSLVLTLQGKVLQMQAHRVALLRNTLKLYFREHIASDALVACIVAGLDIYFTTFAAIPPHLNTKITSGRKNNQRTLNASKLHFSLKKISRDDYRRTAKSVSFSRGILVCAQGGGGTCVRYTKCTA